MLCQDEFLQPAAEILQRSKPIDFALGVWPGNSERRKFPEIGQFVELSSLQGG